MSRVLSVGKWTTGRKSPEEDIAKAQREIEAVHNEAGSADKMLLAEVYEVVITVFLWIALIVLVAWYYNANKVYPSAPPNDGESHLPADLDGQWKFGFFDCVAVPGLSAFTCCC